MLFTTLYVNGQTKFKALSPVIHLCFQKVGTKRKIYNPNVEAKNYRQQGNSLFVTVMPNPTPNLKPFSNDEGLTNQELKEQFDGFTRRKLPF